jgi:hypothetical protein
MRGLGVILIGLRWLVLRILFAYGQREINLVQQFVVVWIGSFFVSPEWEFYYTGLMQKKLLRVCSDHAPIFLASGCPQSGKRAFKFENMWLKEESFVAKVKVWWDSFQFFGSPSFVLAKKLKALKWEIMRWNLEEFGDVRERNKAGCEELKALDRTEEGKQLTEEEKDRRRQISKRVGSFSSPRGN